jgi:hypothetical protein
VVHYEFVIEINKTTCRLSSIKVYTCKCIGSLSHTSAPLGGAKQVDQSGSQAFDIAFVNQEAGFFVLGRRTMLPSRNLVCPLHD